MLKKIIVLAVIFTALTFSVPALADEPSPTPTETPTPTPEIDAFTKFSIVKGANYDINSMMNYYHNFLTDEQKDIARFLLGSYNYMYVSARGFSYENVNTFEEYVKKFFDVADLVFGVDFIESNSSRWSGNFQIFIASIISYAGNINETFDTWLVNTAPHLLIPYSEDWLDAWTSYYNDPSNEGISSFGFSERDWTSGILYPYAFGDYPFYENADQTRYQNFVLNESPILYNKSANKTSPSYDYVQLVFSFKDIPVIDTIYVLRGNSYNLFRFGDYAGNFYNTNVPNIELLFHNDNRKFVQCQSGYNLKYNDSILAVGSNVSLTELYQFACNHGIFNYSGAGASNNLGGDWYPFLTHVVLVDDLNTLSNRQDIYNDFSLGLQTDSVWIKTPKTNMPYWWQPIDFDIKIEDPQGNLNISDDDDFNNSIVNNTVINNYDIVAPGVTINVPVNWFESDGNYLEYTYNYGLPFFVFVGDMFNSLGEIRIIILGVLVFGLVSGIIVKFLQ